MDFLLQVTHNTVCIRSCWSALHIWDYQIYCLLFQCRFNQDTWFSMWTLVLVSLDLKPLQIALHVESVTRVSASSRYSGHLELDDKPDVNIFLFYYCWIDIHAKQYQCTHVISSVDMSLWKFRFYLIISAGES